MSTDIPNEGVDSTLIIDNAKNKIIKFLLEKNFSILDDSDKSNLENTSFYWTDLIQIKNWIITYEDPNYSKTISFNSLIINEIWLTNFEKKALWFEIDSYKKVIPKDNIINWEKEKKEKKDLDYTFNTNLDNIEMLRDSDKPELSIKDERFRNILSMDKINEMLSDLPLIVDKVDIDLRCVYKDSLHTSRFEPVITLYDKFGNTAEITHPWKFITTGDIVDGGGSAAQLYKLWVNELLPYINDFAWDVLQRKFDNSVRKLWYENISIIDEDNIPFIEWNINDFSSFDKELIINSLNNNINIDLNNIKSLNYEEKNNQDISVGCLIIEFKSWEKKKVSSGTSDLNTSFNDIVDWLNRLKISDNKKEYVFYNNRITDRGNDEFDYTIWRAKKDYWKK